MKTNSIAEAAIKGIDITEPSLPEITITELLASNLVMTEVDLEGTPNPETEENLGTELLGYRVDTEDATEYYMCFGTDKTADELLDEIVEQYPEDEYSYANWTR